jgi:hypothetical protein
LYYFETYKIALGLPFDLGNLYFSGQISQSVSGTPETRACPFFKKSGQAIQ